MIVGIVTASTTTPEKSGDLASLLLCVHSLLCLRFVHVIVYQVISETESLSSLYQLLQLAPYAPVATALKVKLEFEKKKKMFRSG